MNINFGKRIRIAVLTTLLVSTLQAHAEKQGFQVLVDDETRHGQALMRGETERAIQALEKSMSKRSPTFAVYNNLCVAQILSKDLVAAKASCDAALEASSVSQRRGFVGWLLQPKRQNRASALVNRGVIYALTGEPENARRDFAEAQRTSKSLPQPPRNLALLDSQERLAQTASTQ